MKKMILLILMSFAVLAYAAPPPLEVDVIADQVQYVVQNDVQQVEFVAQEVAFVYLGNPAYIEAPVFAEKFEPGANVPPVPVLTINYSTCSFMADLPMPNRAEQQPVYNFNRDLQYNNYGYPLSMN